MIEVTERAKKKLPEMFGSETGRPTIRVYVTGHG